MSAASFSWLILRKWNCDADVTTPAVTSTRKGSDERMHIVVCVKQVPDPDAVNSAASTGDLQVDQGSRQLQLQGIPEIINSYDEQAIELALRLKDRGEVQRVTVVSVNADANSEHLRRSLAMGADDAVLVQDPAYAERDGCGVAAVLARAIAALQPVGAILCGRQASDDDQGVVGPALAGILGVPIVTIVRDLEVVGGHRLRISRVLPDGEELLEAAPPAVLTVSNEAGTPRFPTLKGIISARGKEIRVLGVADLLRGQDEVSPQVCREAVSVPNAQGQCQFIDGETVEEKADNLLAALTGSGLLP